MKAGIKEIPFGSVNGKAVKLFTITTPSGMEVSVMNLGATLTRIITPDKEGMQGNILMGFADAEYYRTYKHCYFGSIVGRYANRIANASFVHNGKEYLLEKNEGANCLHGGFAGFHQAFWAIEKNAGGDALVAKYRSADGEAGFPGNLDITVTYTLSDENGLEIDYHAITDQSTPVNLTSHGYFNLSAGKSANVLDHELQINASQYTVLNEQQVPTGELNLVEETVFDFTQRKPIGKNIIDLPKGYDLNYVLDINNDIAAQVYHPESGRVMTVKTTEPGLQFYSANFPFPLHQESSKEPELFSSFCLEAQHFPNSPNEPSFPSTMLNPGEVYQQHTAYLFSIK